MSPQNRYNSAESYTFEERNFVEKFFKLKESGTDVRTELTAGVITFLSMVYILAVNPSILSGCGMDAGAVFTATAISAAAATLFMAFFANYPIALASGMGLNAYFSYSVCGQMAAEGIGGPVDGRPGGGPGRGHHLHPALVEQVPRGAGRRRPQEPQTRHQHRYRPVHRHRRPEGRGHRRG